MPAPISPTRKVSDRVSIMYELVRYIPRPRNVKHLRSIRMARTAEAERQRDPVRTRAEILDVATAEFAEHGYSGARVDEIAERTRTTKRMLYYYFDSKEGLYTAVLERAYAQIRAAEQTVDREHLDPVAALPRPAAPVAPTRPLAELTCDHHEAHPDFIRLVSIENIHRAEHMRASGRFAD